MQTLRFLIVEDDPAYQISLEMLLEKLGHDYQMVDSGEQALTLVQESPFDLALLDIQLAGEMNGIELAKTLSGRFFIPVVFLTANDDLSTYEEASTVADALYLVKPVNELTLRSIIQMTLRKNSFVLQPDTTPRTAPSPGFIYLKFKGRTERVEIQDIIYARADGNYCYLHTQRRRYVIKTSLLKVSEKLHPPAFVQIHRSVIVRLKSIVIVDLATNKVQVGKEMLPLGASFKDDLILRLH